MMPRKPGEVSPRQAARILGVHTNTVRIWCYAVRDGSPSPLPPDALRITPTRRYWIRRDALDVLTGEKNARPVSI